MHQIPAHLDGVLRLVEAIVGPVTDAATPQRAQLPKKAGVKLVDLVVKLGLLLVLAFALGGLELSLSHGLLFLLVVLVCPAHCMLNADLVQLIRTDATVS